MPHKLLASICAAMIVAGAAASASAQSPNNKSVFFTFSQPVTLPQVTLPAGRYMFETLGLTASRSVVVVYSGDRSKHLAMLMTIPTTRPDRPENAELRFMETDATTPPAIRTWWYPGERRGWEFIYPREQALKLAKTAEQPVLTTTREATSDEMKSADLVRVGPTGQQVGVADNADATAVAGDVERGEVAPSTNATALQSSNMSASAEVAQSRETRTRLPETASLTPAISLAGLIALCAAAILVRPRRRLVN